MPPTQITMLSSMAGRDFIQALDQHVAWNIRVLDLKDGIFGKSVADLTDDEARHAADLIKRRGLSIYCLSTMLSPERWNQGQRYSGGTILTVWNGSLLSPRSCSPPWSASSRRKHARAKRSATALRMYGDAVHRLYRVGFPVTIENAVGNNILSTPAEVVDFFAGLNCKGEVGFTWDVQNLWQMGTYPTMEVYRRLKGVIRYYHLKGRQHGPDSLTLRWRTSLEDASWPVVEITRQVVADGVSPVICLNPPHGEPKEGYNYSNLAKRDLDLVRRVTPGVE